MARKLFTKLSLEDENYNNIYSETSTDTPLSGDVEEISNAIEKNNEIMTSIEEAEELIEDITISAAGDEAALVADNHTSDACAASEVSASKDITNEIAEIAEAVGGNIEIKSIEASQEELKSFYRRAGMPRYRITQESFGAIKLSRENILKEKSGLISTLSKGIKHTFYAGREILGTITNIFPNLFLKYNASKLQELLQDVKDGKLVPKKQLTPDDIKALNDIFGSAGEFGFTLGGDCKDIITYISAVIDQVDEHKKGSLGDILKTFDGFLTNGMTNERRNIESTELFARLAKAHPEGLEIDPHSDRFITGWIINPFGSYLSIFCAIKPPKKSGLLSTILHDMFFRASTDIIRNPKPANVAPATVKGLQDLLEFGIKNEKRIQNLGRSTKIIGTLQLFASHLASVNLEKFLIRLNNRALTNTAMVYAFGAYNRAGIAIRSAAMYTARALSTLDSKIAKAIYILTEKK